MKKINKMIMMTLIANNLCAQEKQFDIEHITSILNSIPDTQLSEQHRSLKTMLMHVSCFQSGSWWGKKTTSCNIYGGLDTFVKNCHNFDPSLMAFIFSNGFDLTLSSKTSQEHLETLKLNKESSCNSCQIVKIFLENKIAGEAAKIKKAQEELKAALQGK